MKVIRTLLLILAGLVLLFGLFLVYATLDDYRPEPGTLLYETEEPGLIPDSATLSVLTWNIGYAGLDAGMDFFYDGGNQVRPDKETVNRNLEGIKEQLRSFGGYDFILLQEVDRKARRSYRNNEYGQIEALFPSHNSTFGINYRVTYVPVPLRAPMGGVVSGIQTLSKSVPATVNRYSFPGNYSWPVRLFMLDRCFIVGRYPVSGGRELVLINTHNSAYDDGTLRKEQMDYLRSFLLKEYAAGNYVLAGGDWNQSPAGFEPLFGPERFDHEDLTYIPDSYPDPLWTWAFDAAVPTNRRVKIPYDPVNCPVTVIDQFLLSPNITLLEVKGIENGFLFSDHQPVSLKVKLK